MPHVVHNGTGVRACMQGWEASVWVAARLNLCVGVYKWSYGSLARVRRSNLKAAVAAAADPAGRSSHPLKAGRHMNGEAAYSRA
jgi:hypothetical protein